MRVHWSRDAKCRFSASPLMITPVERTRWRRLVATTPQALPEPERQQQVVGFVQAALRRNPFALAMVDTTIGAAVDEAAALALIDAFDAAVAGQLDDKEHALYRRTVHQLGHARPRALPPLPSTSSRPRRESTAHPRTVPPQHEADSHQQRPADPRQQQEGPEDGAVAARDEDGEQPGTHTHRGLAAAARTLESGTGCGRRCEVDLPE